MFAFGPAGVLLRGAEGDVWAAKEDVLAVALPEQPERAAARSPRKPLMLVLKPSGAPRELLIPPYFAGSPDILAARSRAGWRVPTPNLSASSTGPRPILKRNTLGLRGARWKRARFGCPKVSATGHGRLTVRYWGACSPWTLFVPQGLWLALYCPVWRRHVRSHSRFWAVGFCG